ncbi:MAG: hypothetical protein KGY70_10535 [Bacteroidales bacterium]|nr:hypothetical protein [Bacteroidales bacterium]
MKKYLIFILYLMMAGYGHAQEVEIVTRKNEGVFNITQTGYMPGVGNISYDGDLRANQSEAYRLRTLFGYFITPRFSVALGAGADAYNNPSYNTFPVFADVRAYLHDARNTPYVFFDLGKSLPVAPEIEEGMFINGGVGFKYFVSERICLNTEIGYNYQRMNPEKHYFSDLLNIGFKDMVPSNFKALSVNVGLVFELWALRKPATELTGD